MNISPISIAIASAFLITFSQGAIASNQLQDPGFETPTGVPDSPYSCTGIGYGGDSAADQWGIYNFNSGTTVTTDQYSFNCPSGLSDEGMYSMEVSTTAVDDGLQQGFVATGSAAGSVSGYFYVLSGSVGIGLESVSDQVVVYASTATTGQWIFLGANTGGLSGGQEFEIVSLSPNSEFYVDNVDADTNALTPEPASFAALGFGAFGLLVRRRRTTK